MSKLDRSNRVDIAKTVLAVAGIFVLGAIGFGFFCLKVSAYWALVSD